MKIIKWIFQRKREYLLVIIPAIILISLLKLLNHQYGLECFAMKCLPFFLSAFTGVIFLMGFILVGVITDYKESEKFPSQIYHSLYSIWQEAQIESIKNSSQYAKNIKNKLIKLTEIFKTDFLVNNKQNIFSHLDSILEEFAKLDNTVPAPSMARIRGEHANLNRILLRINIIRNTDFAPGIYKMLLIIIFLFALILILTKFDFLLIGVAITAFYTLLFLTLFTVLIDLDNPFEYKTKNKENEIDFSILDDFLKRIAK